MVDEDVVVDCAAGVEQNRLELLAPGANLTTEGRTRHRHRWHDRRHTPERERDFAVHHSRYSVKE